MLARTGAFCVRQAEHTGVAVGVFIGLVILCNAFSTYFITQENYIYYWDYSGYWNTYREISESLVNRPLATLHSMAGSIRNDDYNSLPVLALVPFERLFGPGRLAYILAITNLYLLPGAVIMGLVARRTLWQRSSKDDSLLPLVLAIAGILTLHTLWTPVLRGYPDVVGIVAIGAVLLIHLAKPLAEQRLESLAATGLILCLLVLLRRWYLFWIVAFFPAAAVAHGLEIYRRHGIAWKHYMVASRNALIICLAFLLSFVGLATPLATRALRTDYSDIYSAYRHSNSLLEAVARLPSYFGWAAIIGSLAGIGWLTLRKETRVVGSFLITQSIIVFVLFARTQDFGAHHYYLLIPAVALGVAVTIMKLTEQFANGFWRTASVGLLIVSLLASSGAVFAPEAVGLSRIFGDAVPKVRTYPLVRNDIEMLDGILDRLNELEQQQPGDIYVLASSAILNSNILQNDCQFGSRHRNFCNRILTTNDVDKRDGFPHQFLHASYLIVASPTQYHLRADDQRVIGVLAREVTEGKGISASFQRLSGEFKLDKGVTVWVYAKIRPFERTDLGALAEEFGKYYPDKQPIFRTIGE